MADGDFNINWKWWYIFRPSVSCTVGLFVYFLIAGGLLTIGLISGNTSNDVMLFFCGVSFISGLSVKKVLKLLDTTANRIFTNSNIDEQRNMPQLENVIMYRK